MALPQAHAPDSPATFGKYELLGLLGTGGMAEVFLARAVGPMGFERRVVVKRILPHLSRDEEFVEMFVAEAKLSAVLSHGNIVQVYDFGEVDGQLFLAMEHVEGSDLRSLARKAALAGVTIPPELSAFIAIEILSALAYAHERTDWHGEPLGLVHRDVSPSNVLLSRAGEVKLCDFGIAKIAARHTSTGRLKGKFAYMSPEQAGGGAVDGRSDLWSVGVILWELLSGRRLFQADSDVAVLGLVCRGDIPGLPALGCQNEALLRPVVERALDRAPERRYADATAMAEDLREYLAGAVIRDPSRLLRELVQRFGVEPIPTTGKAKPPVALAEPTALLPTPEDPTEQKSLPAAPATQSAVVEVRRFPTQLVVIAALALLLIAGLLLLLWPAPERPIPHAAPGWSGPTAVPLLPPLPPVRPSPVHPPTLPAPAVLPGVLPSPDTAAPAPSAVATPPTKVREPRPTPEGTRAARPDSRPTPPEPPPAEREPATPPRTGSTRESTVDPFAIQ